MELLREKKPPHRRQMKTGLLFLLFVLARLIGNAAAGLARGLAGCLAFAATAILSALAQIPGLQGLDMLHLP